VGVIDLDIEQLTVRFGGLTAVDNVSLRAEANTITGLIGPNGAGKTTTFNACTGMVHAAEGHIRLGDTNLDHQGTASRAARGLGRTFQRMELFDSMTVAENVAMGPEAVFSSRRPWGQIIATRRESREIGTRAVDAMDRCGIHHLADLTTGDLSTGQRRLVELARAIASPFQFLLLDEPSSGLDPQETEIFGSILTSFVAETGTGVLLVEHDMALVASVCSYIYVLDFGRLIFQGTKNEALESELVRAAYLGSEAVEMHSQSGTGNLRSVDIDEGLGVTSNV
jgi:ABC-type branched-subunit amino acid transport system ATPase component